jgi:hypothetical protein
MAGLPQIGSFSSGILFAPRDSFGTHVELEVGARSVKATVGYAAFAEGASCGHLGGFDGGLYEAKGGLLKTYGKDSPKGFRESTYLGVELVQSLIFPIGVGVYRRATSSDGWLFAASIGFSSTYNNPYGRR